LVKPENYKEITEEEFNINLNECKKFISSLWNPQTHKLPWSKDGYWMATQSLS
jgi:hypothetical protein